MNVVPVIWKQIRLLIVAQVPQETLFTRFISLISHRMRALWGKGNQDVLRAITDIEHALPFQLRGFDCDNGNEFLNWHLFRMFENRKQKVQFTRSRPYRKNDNVYIEGKNWTAVIQYMGYERFDHPLLAASLNEIYTSELRFFMNFFVPSSKLTDKKRVGAKITKQYDKPKTPYKRNMNMPEITNTTKNDLTKLYKSLNPFVLQSKNQRISSIKTPFK